MIWWHTSAWGIKTNDDCAITFAIGELTILEANLTTMLLWFNTIDKWRKHKHKWQFIKHSPGFKKKSDGIDILIIMIRFFVSTTLDTLISTNMEIQFLIKFSLHQFLSCSFQCLPVRYLHWGAACKESFVRLFSSSV